MNMNDAVRRELIAALRSGDYVQGGRGRMSEGEDPGTHEPAGVLCLLGVKAEVIPPPTRQRVGDDITWLYRGHAGDDALPSCISIPVTVLRWTGLKYLGGDPFVVDGHYRTWAGHANAGVTFEQFADALEALDAPASAEEATAV